MKFTTTAAACSLLALEMPSALGFSYSASSSLQSSHSSQVQSIKKFHPSTILKSASVDKSETEADTSSSAEDLFFPLSFDEVGLFEMTANFQIDCWSCSHFFFVHSQQMVRQASSTMEDAYSQGKTRQMIRILLPRSADNDNLGQYFEADAVDNEMEETVLVPPDETWQGGISKSF